MGGSLGGIFSNKGQGDDDKPSFLQNLVQGTAKGAGTGFGKGMTTGAPGAAPLPAAPGATPVDPAFFAPTANPRVPLPNGGSPGMVQPLGSSAFYG